MDKVFVKEPCMKVTMMGCCYVGKTSIINRLINRSYSHYYDPTEDIETYSFRLNLNEEEVAQKTYINVICLVYSFPLYQNVNIFAVLSVPHLANSDKKAQRVFILDFDILTSIFLPIHCTLNELPIYIKPIFIIIELMLTV